MIGIFIFKPGVNSQGISEKSYRLLLESGAEAFRDWQDSTGMAAPTYFCVA